MINFNYIYTVNYYQIGYESATVYTIGFYDNILDAKERLTECIHGYTKHINNTVKGSGRIGWINKNTFGDFKSELSASQPHSSINLFDGLD